MLKIDQSVHGIPHLELYAKLEYMNPFGSVKDRSAWGMIKDDITEIQRSRKKIIEMSSGNTAKALQGIASTFGIPFKTITNRIRVDEMRDILTLMGSEIEELPGESDCHDPHDPHDPQIFIYKEIKKDPEHRFYTSQYNNQKNIDEHYRTTGEEILKDLEHIDYYFAGLGTTGSSRGPAMKIKERDINLQVHGIVSDKHDYIPGIRTIDEMYQVGLLDPDYYTDIHHISSTSAIEGMLTLVKRCGIMSGPTGGAVYASLIQFFQDNPPTEKKVAVFVVCDRMESYMSYVRKRRPELFGERKKVSWQDNLTVDKKVSIDISKFHRICNEEKDNLLVIDMRSALAFRSTHLPHSVNIPFAYLEDMFSQGSNPFCLKKKIVFVCPLGEVSSLVASFLRKKGVNSYSLEGGITALRDAGYKLEQDI